MSGSGKCGEDGLCTTCWAIQHDEHAPTLRAQRDKLRAVLDEIQVALEATTLSDNRRTSELIIPAPRQERWWDAQIANMVGQVVTLDGRKTIVKWSGPLDGSPEEGAGAVVLIVEALDG